MITCTIIQTGSQDGFLFISCLSWKGLYVFSYLKANHETEIKCTSLISAITYCLAGKFYHTFWGLEERWKLLNISTSSLTLAV